MNDHKQLRILQLQSTFNNRELNFLSLCHSSKMAEAIYLQKFLQGHAFQEVPFSAPRLFTTLEMEWQNQTEVTLETQLPWTLIIKITMWFTLHHRRYRSTLRSHETGILSLTHILANYLNSTVFISRLIGKTQIISLQPHRYETEGSKVKRPKVATLGPFVSSLQMNMERRTTSRQVQVG